VKYENSSVHPLDNGLSDHDAQSIRIFNISVDKRIGKTHSVRKFNKFPLSQFKINLGYEKWDVFIEEDVNTGFYNFLNTYLRIFNSSFPLQKTYSTHDNIQCTW